MKKIIIFGKNGQLANAFLQIPTLIADFYDSSRVNFSDIVGLKFFLDNLSSKPDIIINCSAYTNVDKAEDEQGLCNTINHLAVEVLANFCFLHNIRLIHYSTDYVFNGSGSLPFTEEDTQNLQPLNFYGATKLLAEQKISQSKCSHLIFRVSWLFDRRPTSKNFVNTILRLAQERETLKIVDDQIGSPTLVDFVAQNTLLSLDIPSGIYHLNNGIYMSWYQFAQQIINNSQQQFMLKQLLPIASSDYTTKATRPLNSRLDNSKIKSVIKIKV